MDIERRARSLFTRVRLQGSLGFLICYLSLSAGPSIEESHSPDPDSPTAYSEQRKDGCAWHPASCAFHGSAQCSFLDIIHTRSCARAFSRLSTYEKTLTLYQDRAEDHIHMHTDSVVHRRA